VGRYEILELLDAGGMGEVLPRRATRASAATWRVDGDAGRG
jgi:hypothetical protein